MADFQGKVFQREELNKIAKGNKVALPSDQELQMFKKIENDSIPTSNNETLLDLLKNPKLLCRLLNVFLNWTVITMIYYGLSMNAASLAGDIFVNFALLSLTEDDSLPLCGKTGAAHRDRMVTYGSLCSCCPCQWIPHPALARDKGQGSTKDYDGS